ncbi:MAG: M50 family metallopeptidase [Candidatus Woesearchaeota archaeon]
MAFISLQEIIEILIMTVAIGFIFSRFFPRKPKEDYDPLTYFNKSPLNNLWEDIKHGAIIAAPAVVLHELAHKVVAMSFGATATLHAPLTMYAIVIILILIRFPIIFFVGGYVSHTALPAFQSSLVSVAGPLTNIILWAVFFFISKQHIGKKYRKEMMMMAKINLFLAAFNMIPFPGFDGFNFFRALLIGFGIL